MDAPAGLIRTKAIVKDGKVESVTLTNVPSFVYKENQKADNYHNNKQAAYFNVKSHL